jgi:prepilin-type N-terminal cleavage/methylation domain-containing protein
MRKRGFTLVEMLVATALVVLMMLMFAQIFQTAGGLVSNQKGMAKQDQSLRTLTILLRGDIGQRTFREVIPFFPGQDTEAGDFEPEKRRGFFSISENDPDDATDDVLHLTIKMDDEAESPLQFFGKATLIRRAGNAVPADPPDADIDTAPEAELYLLGDASNPANNDQPEFDDGQLSLNGTGSSRFVEVCWFLRNGVLYRRALLIRDRYATPINTDTQPTNAFGARFIPDDYSSANIPPATAASGEFWRDFDYSAYYEPNGGLRFHDVDSLINSSANNPGSNPNLLNLPASLGLPFLRFGSSTSRASTGPLTIRGPRELLTPGDKSTWIGRFTHQETSHSAFDYPGNLNGGDPLNDATPLSLANGLVTEFSNETFRRGEDIVMSNVHSFDIQVWDDSLARFVNTGNGAGDYASTANADYGNRYDTWHPNAIMPDPPYRPTVTDPVTFVETPKPLRAVQVQIRFFDVGSDSMRDLTFTFPLK